jgi:membrane-bound ClpP family serine protease
LWLATSSQDIANKERVMITAKEGIVLVVERTGARVDEPAPLGEGAGAV